MLRLIFLLIAGVPTVVLAQLALDRINRWPDP